MKRGWLVLVMVMLSIVIQFFVSARYSPRWGIAIAGSVFPTESRFVRLMEDIFVFDFSAAISGNPLLPQLVIFVLPKMNRENIERTRICFIYFITQYNPRRNLDSQSLVYSGVSQINNTTNVIKDGWGFPVILHRYTSVDSNSIPIFYIGERFYFYKNISSLDCWQGISALFSGIGSVFGRTPQGNIKESKTPSKNHQPESISSYRIILDSGRLTIIVFIFSIFGWIVCFTGLHLIRGRYRIYGYIVAILGLYIALCTGLGIEYPWLPFSGWWRWFL